MNTKPNTNTKSRLPSRNAAWWTGAVLTAAAVLFLLFDSAGKLLKMAPVIAGTIQLGYPEDVVRPLGVILLAALSIHLVPRLSVVGALLLTGYLGGAVATHVRVGSPLLTHTLFPVYLGVLIWGGLYLRDRRVRSALAGSPEADSVVVRETRLVA